MTTAIEPFVTIEDLALHFAVSVSTIRAWVRQGYIPKDCYVKVGMTYRFKVSACERALSQAPDPMTMPIQKIDGVTKREPEPGVSKDPHSNLDLNVDHDA